MTGLHAADRRQILAFRLGGQHLSQRLPADRLLEAAGACGLPNTPPGAALLSLHARLEALPPSALDTALETEKSLLQTWSLRGAPHIFPGAQAAAFTRGLLPEGEEELRGFLPGMEHGLRLTGLSAGELVARTRQAVLEELDGRILANKSRLDAVLARRVRDGLPAAELAAWDSASPYAAGQTLGEALVSFALRPVALLGCICFAPRRGNEASFARTDQWMGDSIPDDPGAGAELVHRYLGCYGPSRVEHFAAWAGISGVQAARLWREVEPELAPVSWQGGRNFLHPDDLPRFNSPDQPRGVRFLPPHDPYLQSRDHATQVAGPALQRQVWRRAGSPGVVLVDGELVATWRSQTKPRRLVVTVEPFQPMGEGTKRLVEEAAEEMGVYRGRDAVEVMVAPG